MSLVYPFDRPLGLSASDARALLGGKAANLAEMAGTLRLPVPPGFAITTAGCNAFLAHGWPDGLDDEIRAGMRAVEERVGRRFGDPRNPLLVSVRSGAPVSMPGMMDTILNLGLTEATTAGLAAASGDPAFARDCHDRFIAMYTDIVAVEAVPDDPWLQLRGAVEAVFRSWNNERAVTYRRREGIPDDLGTAVTVQAMVFGNRGQDSATGVLFTRNPATGEATIYGDVMFDAQGEDVVAGTHQTEPLAMLDERLPSVGRELRRCAGVLERHFADLCDIEFTVERGVLWLLQVRVGKRSPQAALRIAVEMAEDADFPLSRSEAVTRVARYLANPPRASLARSDAYVALATGLPASPGVATGEIATSPEAVEVAADAGRPAILCRSETSPDDVRGMTRAVGILTANGGLASHAAVVARGWGIPAVVGAAAMTVGDGAIEIAGRHLPAAQTITIDGSTGQVFAGVVPGSSEVVPEAATLLDWAAELGIEIPSETDRPIATADDGTVMAADGSTGGAGPVGALSGDDLVRALLIKGLATPEQLGAAVRSDPERLAPLTDDLVQEGLAESLAGAVRLTAAGKARGQELIAADRQGWGADQAVTALDAFLTLDHRVKTTVTAWQLKGDGAEPVLNDHTDAAYDGRVLDDLAALHEDADRWIAANVACVPRLEAYRARLAGALGRAQAGDQRYVASPRVDSYHTVWFELHEDLILLAGRNRADETAAGRA